MTGIPDAAPRQGATVDTSVAGGVWKVTAAEAGRRLDEFLRDSSRLATRGAVRRAIERGKVLLNDADAAPADVAVVLRRGDRIRFWPDRPGTATARWRHAPPSTGGQDGPSGSDRLHIVYEDSSLVVVNKPAGLLTVPLSRRADADSVADLLERHQRSRGTRRRPLVVHRIDRDTSGLVMFARNPAAQQALKAQFEAREPERVYLAIVEGVPASRAGAWVDWLEWDGELLTQTRARPGDPRARESRSEYRVVEAWPGVPAAALEVRLVTGKGNQIRVQAQLRGHPLIGERMYTERMNTEGTSAGVRALPPFPRQALHAWRLAVRHPVTGRRLALEAPIPADLKKLMGRLRGGHASQPELKGKSPKINTNPGTRMQSSSSYNDSKE
jgi:23S rRNA pseudouridine1911/1915/1917 synthase